MNYSDAPLDRKKLHALCETLGSVPMYALKAGVFWQLPEEKLYKNSSL